MDTAISEDDLERLGQAYQAHVRHLVVLLARVEADRDHARHAANAYRPGSVYVQTPVAPASDGWRPGDAVKGG